jgi:hypothetical protein
MRFELAGGAVELGDLLVGFRRVELEADPGHGGRGGWGLTGIYLFVAIKGWK